MNKFIIIAPVLLFSTNCFAKTTSYKITNRLSAMSAKSHHMMGRSAKVAVKGSDGKRVSLQTRLCYDKNGNSFDCLSKNNGKRKLIRNCNEYWMSNGNINYSSNVDYQIEGIFIKKCNVLKLKMNEKPITSSGVKNVVVASVNFLKEITLADINYTISSHKKYEQVSVLDTMTEEEKSKIKIDKKNKSISFQIQDSWHIIQEIDRGNFDNTGDDSILVYKESGVIGGTKREYSTILLKRDDMHPEYPLELVIFTS